MNKQKLLKLAKIKFLVVVILFCEVALLFPFRSTVNAEELNKYLYPQNDSVVSKNILYNSLNTGIVNKPQPPTPAEIEAARIKMEEDARIAKEKSYAEAIDSYLASKGSPMSGHGMKLVEVEKRYGVSPKLIIAISGVESGYCRINFAAYNCWGWFGGGAFSGYNDAIEQYAHYISSFYFTKGLYNPYTIGPVYCPGSSTWAPNVTRYMNQARF